MDTDREGDKATHRRVSEKTLRSYSLIMEWCELFHFFLLWTTILSMSWQLQAERCSCAQAGESQVGDYFFEVVFLRLWGSSYWSYHRQVMVRHGLGSSFDKSWSCISHPLAAKISYLFHLYLFYATLNTVIHF